MQEHVRLSRPHAKEPAVLSLLRGSSAAVLVVAGVCLAVRATAHSPPSKEQIAQWVKQLGDEEFAVREEASRRLWEAGDAAEEAVREAAQSGDAEVARRSRLLFDKFKWGIYPDTPPRIVELIHRFHTAANPDQRAAVAGQLLDAGWPGCRAVLKIAASADDAATRSAVSATLTHRVVRVAPYLLRECRPDALELLVEAARKVDDKHGGAAHYAAYWSSRGQLDERIRHHQEAAGKSDDKQEYLTLVYLHRARGDLAAERKAAEAAGRRDLVEALLCEAGDWRELNRLGAPAVAPQPVEQLGLRAAYQRLGGDDQRLRSTLAQLREQAEGDGPNEMRHFRVAKALFLNDRPAEALELLGAGVRHRVDRFEILCAQTKFREAITEAEQFSQRHVLPDLEIAVARTLCSLGEKDKALPLFDRYAAQIKEGTEAVWFANLVETEYRLGLHDRAFEHFARVLAVSKDKAWPAQLLPQLFPNQGDAALVWWGLLLPRHAGKAAEALKQLRDLLAGTLPAKEVTRLVEEAMIQKAEHPDRYYVALAEAALAARQEALGLRCLEQAPSNPTSLTRRGDLLAARERWDEAAQLYRRAWEAAPEQPLPLYLAGRALVRAGKDQEGRQLIDQAHLLPLGDEEVRLEFAQALARRGATDESRREIELVNRFSEPGSFWAGEALRRAAFTAAARQDWAAAAAGQEKAMLRCLRADIGFHYPSAYVTMPALVHRLRARAALAADNIEEARRAIALGQAAQPGNVEMAIALVPELDRKGHPQDAAELFEQTLAPWAKVCVDYPRCAEAHNSAAWLSACCRRNLEKALEHALKAVELQPTASSYHDTLAEVCFQRGDREKALAAQRKAIELNPNRSYYRKQLQRIEAGDPAAPRPPEDD
jgi:tetratricopeptide (TPR) repeat protein